MCFRLLHSTGHTDLNVDSELHKLGKAAWTCLDAPSWKEQTGSVHVSPAVEQGDVEMGTAGVKAQSAFTGLHVGGEKLQS